MDYNESFIELRKIFDSLVFPVIAVNENFKVTRLNKAALDRSFISKFQVAIGQSCYEVLYNRKNICPYCPYTELKNFEEKSIEKIIHEKTGEGEEKTLRLLFHKMDSDKLKFLETIEDITLQRELQEETVRFERLAAMGTMVSGIAHELNNPITGMGLTLQNLKANISTMSSDEILQRVNLISKDLDRAGRVVDDILTFSRPGEIKLNPGNVTTVIHRARANTQRLYPILSRRVQWEIEADGEIICDIHTEKLERVFINLFKNSLQAFDYNEGIIRVEIKKTAKWVHIIIEDNAGGIPGSILNKIFHPFFTNSPNKKGTGLGLTLCHSIITEHHGKIRVRSLNNQTKFYLSLPFTYRGGDNGP